MENKPLLYNAERLIFNDRKHSCGFASVTWKFCFVTIYIWCQLSIAYHRWLNILVLSCLDNTIIELDCEQPILVAHVYNLLGVLLTRDEPKKKNSCKIYPYYPNTRQFDNYAKRIPCLV